MKKATLRGLMSKLGITASKKMGQNFLTDDNFLEYIVREAQVREGDHLLEVGPGFGALTEGLLKTGAELTAIEFDRKLAAYIRENLVPRGLKLIEGDACKVKIAEIYGEDVPFRLVSNLPYSAGTIIVANMLDLKTPPLDMLIMLQKEVAERFAAPCGTGEYSALTIRIQAMYDAQILKLIPPDLFYPEPEVSSALMRLTLKPGTPSPELRKILSRLVRTAFAHRRKKMYKQIAAIFGDEAITAAMAHAGVDMDIRAERVTVAQFLAMAAELQANA